MSAISSPVPPVLQAGAVEYVDIKLNDSLVVEEVPSAPRTEVRGTEVRTALEISSATPSTQQFIPSGLFSIRTPSNWSSESSEEFKSHDFSTGEKSSTSSSEVAERFFSPGEPSQTEVDKEGVILGSYLAVNTPDRKQHEASKYSPRDLTPLRVLPPRVDEQLVSDELLDVHDRLNELMSLQDEELLRCSQDKLDEMKGWINVLEANMFKVRSSFFRVYYSEIQERFQKNEALKALLG